jgi:hypothetical protein
MIYWIHYRIKGEKDSVSLGNQEKLPKICKIHMAFGMPYDFQLRIPNFLRSNLAMSFGIPKF